MHFCHKVNTDPLPNHIEFMHLYNIYLFSSLLLYLSPITLGIPPRTFLPSSGITSLSRSVCNLISVYFRQHSQICPSRLPQYTRLTHNSWIDTLIIFCKVTANKKTSLLDCVSIIFYPFLNSKVSIN